MILDCQHIASHVACQYARLVCHNVYCSLPKKAETKYVGDLTPAMTWPLVMGRQIDRAVVLGEHRDPHDLELNHHCNIFCSDC